MFAGFSAVPVILIFVFKKRIVRFNRILMYAVMLILLGLSIAFNKEEPFLISAVYPVYMFIGGVAFIDNMLNERLLAVYFCGDLCVLLYLALF